MSNEEMGWEDSVGDIVSPGDVVAGKYRVDRLLGTGGMGIVVEAFHLHFEERVAIKFLVPQAATEESLTRFEREARAAFKIKSEHVARVIDVGKLDGQVPYMVMEYLEGTDLGILLTDRRAFPIDAAVEYVLQALEAVSEAHALGIVHRDLKPENLFLTKRTDGTPCIKVLDFGLSKATKEDVSQQRQRALTGTAQVMGTPQYMSPEQWMSARDVGPATDQWALGVILYELVTGVQPFEQEQLAQLCTQVLRGEPEPVLKLRPDAPPGLVQIINRCLRKEPKHRFPNVGEMALALLEYGPPRARTSVKRIAGIFRKIGVDPGEIPPSTRGGGLGRNMVLGRPPPSTSSDEIASPPSVDRASFPGLPRPNAPPPRPSQPRASQPSMEPKSRTPSSGDTTKVYQRDPAEVSHVPDPTGGEPPLKTLVSPPSMDAPPPPPPRGERQRADSSTAVLDGQFPVLESPSSDATAQWQKSDGSGGFPLPPSSAATPVAPPPQSQTMAGLPPHPGMGSGAYVPAGPSSVDPGQSAQHQRQAVTAQSWQHMLDLNQNARESRDKKVLFAAIAAMVMFATLVIVLLVSGGSDSPSPAGDGVDDRKERRAADDDGDTPNSRTDSRDDETDPEAADPSASPSSATSASARPSSTGYSAKRDHNESTSEDEEPERDRDEESSNPFKSNSIFDRP
jgi:serine/threonine-protein kinase